MSKLAKRFADKIIHYVLHRLTQAYQDTSGYEQLHHKIQDKVLDDMAEFVLNNIENAMLFRSTPVIQRYSLKKAKKEGLLLEFGAGSGLSMNCFSKQLKAMGDERTIYGFDSFEGLREDWTGSSYSAGDMSRDGMPPSSNDNTKFIKGWIQDTLSPFLEENNSDIAFIHTDVDTYETTRFILDLCKSRLGTGSLILFDELLGGPNWRNHEYKALTEVFSSEEYEYIAFATKRALVRLK